MHHFIFVTKKFSFQHLISHSYWYANFCPPADHSPFLVSSSPLRPHCHSPDFCAKKKRERKEALRSFLLSPTASENQDEMATAQVCLPLAPIRHPPS